MSVSLLEAVLLDYLTNYVNAILAAPESIRLADAGQPIPIYDTKNGETWGRWGGQVVATFTDRWRIEPDPARAGGWLFWRKGE